MLKVLKLEGDDLSTLVFPCVNHQAKAAGQ
jgi:hypothetical protein